MIAHKPGRQTRPAPSPRVLHDAVHEGAAHGERLLITDSGSGEHFSEMDITPRPGRSVARILRHNAWSILR
jgi:hypothetical protein